MLSYIVLIQISIDVSMLEKKYHQMVGKEKEKKKKKKKREREREHDYPDFPTDRKTDRLSFERKTGNERLVSRGEKSFQTKLYDRREAFK